MINGLYSVLINGVPKIKHKDAIDVSTPHALADLVAAVCSETEADTKVATAVEGESSGLREEHGSGTVSGGAAAADNSWDTSVATIETASFATAFSATPEVASQLIGALDESHSRLMPNPSTSGITIRIYNFSTTDYSAYNFTFHWCAIGS